jgi:3-hydroxybutyryl-CoA dehydrogenase
MINNISVIGAGTMGNGIAHVFAQNGFTVQLIDVNPTQLQRALATIGKISIAKLRKSSITEEDKKHTP